MTAAYTQFDSANPTGAQTGPNVVVSTLNNLIALRNSILSGKVKDFVFERVNGTGTAADPQYFYYKNSLTNIWFRATNTWTAGALTSQTWEWSDDAGGTYAAMHGADAVTYDADKNITAGSIGSSMIVIALEALAKAKKLITDLAAHIAGTGTGVHGLGSMATQAASGVAITGGAVNGTTIGATARSTAEFTRTTEDLNTYAPAASAAQAIDWAKGSSKLTTNGTNVLSFSNVPASGIASHVLETSNHNNTTYPAAVTWGLGGKPSIAGLAVVSLITIDGGTTVRGAVMWRAV